MFNTKGSNLSEVCIDNDIYEHIPINNSTSKFKQETTGKHVKLKNGSQN